MIPKLRELTHFGPHSPSGSASKAASLGPTSAAALGSDPDVGAGWSCFEAGLGEDLLPRSTVTGVIQAGSGFRPLWAVGQMPEASVLCHVALVTSFFISAGRNTRKEKRR